MAHGLRGGGQLPGLSAGERVSARADGAASDAAGGRRAGVAAGGFGTVRGAGVRSAVSASWGSGGDGVRVSARDAGLRAVVPARRGQSGVRGNAVPAGVSIPKGAPGVGRRLRGTRGPKVPKRSGSHAPASAGGPAEAGSAGEGPDPALSTRTAAPGRKLLPGRAGRGSFTAPSAGSRKRWTPAARRCTSLPLPET